MNSIIKNRINSLRKHLIEKGLSAFIIPSTDPHISEYVAPHWKLREWISGFTGSAGTIVITPTKAGLWTDSRYFLQASEQLSGTGIDLYKEMLPETPSIAEFISKEISPNSTIGIEGEVFTASEVENLTKQLSKKNIKIDTQVDFIDKIWTDRPERPKSPAYIYDIAYAGSTAIEKIADIRGKLALKNCQSTLLSALDEIAWTLNLRGTDVEYNPVVVSYLLITPGKAILFIDSEKVSPEVKNYLQNQQVEVRNYEEVRTYLSELTLNSVLINSEKTNFAILQAINSACKIISGTSPAAELKAIRNKTEIEGVHNAMKKDGAALVRFLKWLEENVASGTESELSIDKQLHKFRAEQTLYKGESFNTIAGYKEHGAIVHYAATPESNSYLQPKGFLLLDSGAQYLDGTTDITRTIALGELSKEEKTDYTLVLKGHIALAMAKFPAGTRGAQLDVLARMPLWNRGMNYLHGTGHGIGHFLNVHEGPQSIRMNENPVVLQPGMLTSNEPGLYKAGSHGIRTENLVLVVEHQEGMFGKYYAFETVTLCPICQKGIIKEMLSKEEIDWLNNYHEKVYRELSPLLNPEEQKWLQEATKNI
ncbi:aminopeptidase P family protein [Bacteroides sp. 224]|uniref:aminopeptidase P family protein n=1 Tax=Bacteroides sp. 224 TaxID=2302936 RepID=UPI0013D50679|nr:aminopeptidase P family protein [Bacteroides sp. 224]NDV63819.1 aminopeptidase P family protein [Bacteroides sp. 224]